jgi:hypothetical protein
MRINGNVSLIPPQFYVFNRISACKHCAYNCSWGFPSLFWWDESLYGERGIIFWSLLSPIWFHLESVGTFLGPIVVSFSKDG